MAAPPATARHEAPSRPHPERMRWDQGARFILVSSVLLWAGIIHLVSRIF
jgi:hypothetical protein